MPAALARAAGWQVNMPPREHLGWFTQPGDCEAIAEWLRGCEDRLLVVSTDMLCLGGLMASRAPGVGTEEAAARMEVLRELRERRPEVVIYAFSALMRLGTSVTSASGLGEHQALRAYSQLVDRVDRLGEEEARPELESVAERLNAETLSSYLDVRRRNHALNQAAIRLVAEGVIDYLVLAQEDAAPVGLHVPEQLALRDQVAEFRVGERVSIHPGADEAGLVLVARHAVSEAGGPYRIAADYASQAGAEVIPLFETQPLRETVESQIWAAGARVAAPMEADAMIFVHTPYIAQREASEAPPMGQAPTYALQAESVVDRVVGASEAGLRVGLADVSYCNGSDPELMAALARAGAGRHLSGYAGWNTAANSIGTVVSQLCLEASRADERAPGRGDWERLLAARLTDDYGYQTCVRQRAVEKAKAAGVDPHALGSAWPEFELFVREELAPLSHWIYSQVLGVPEGDPLGELRVSLPWHRLFEVEVEVGSSAGPKKRR